MRKLLAATTLILLVSTSAATSLRVPDELTEAPDRVNLTEVRQLYNDNADRVPGIVASLAGDQDTNVYLSGEDYNRSLKIDMDGVRMDQLEKGEWKSPDLEIWMEVSDLKTLKNSTSPMQRLGTMLETGEIRYREHGWLNQLRFALLGLLL